MPADKNVEPENALWRLTKVCVSLAHRHHSAQETNVISISVFVVSMSHTSRSA